MSPARRQDVNDLLNNARQDPDGRARHLKSDDGVALDTRPPIDSDGSWLTAKHASELLGVKVKTLYAYVSREALQTKQRIGSKENLYLREDVEKISKKQRHVGDQARSERYMRLGGGGSLLETSISCIDTEGPRYRGMLSIDLVREYRSFEDCVELLWNDGLPNEPVKWEPLSVPPVLAHLIKAVPTRSQLTESRHLMPIALMASALTASDKIDFYRGTPKATARYMMQIMALMFSVLESPTAFRFRSGNFSIAELIATCSGIATGQVEKQALDACLILSAEHELAPSTLTARVAASGGADLFSCVSSALGTFEGKLGMGCCGVVEDMLRGGKSVNSYVAHLRRDFGGKQPLGYGHPFYPDGDPRGQLLLKIARDLSARGSPGRLAVDAVDHASSELKVFPNLAIGLAAVVIALRMPTGSSAALMALGRTAGWVAHIFEQRAAGFPLRPRARYVVSPSEP